MAVYKPSPHLFIRQVKSIADQTFHNWDCFIVIDGTDAAVVEATHSIVGEDPRFHVREHAERVGFFANFERGLNAVPDTAQWIALADQDDHWLPTKIDALLPHLRDHDLASCQAFVVRNGRREGITRRRRTPLDALMVDNQVTGSLSLISSNLLLTALPFPEGGSVAYHDHWLGLCAATGRGIYIDDKPLQEYVQHASNVIGESDQTTLFTRVRALANSTKGWRRTLVEERLGWRRRMAITILERRPRDFAQVEALTPWSGGRSRLALAILRVMLNGYAPRLRCLALLVAIVLERPAKRETT